jgi:hypothetical protein
MFGDTSQTEPWKLLRDPIGTISIYLIPRLLIGAQICIAAPRPHPESRLPASRQLWRKRKHQLFYAAPRTAAFAQLVDTSTNTLSP